uniref:Uncharacterized protein n=1 Tax=Opuntia streptacantha TaxID=393608 RepID=A0A7C8YPQ0_OPUST
MVERRLIWLSNFEISKSRSLCIRSFPLYETLMHRPARSRQLETVDEMEAMRLERGWDSPEWQFSAAIKAELSSSSLVLISCHLTGKTLMASERDMREDMSEIARRSLSSPAADGEG